VLKNYFVYVIKLSLYFIVKSLNTFEKNLLYKTSQRKKEKEKEKKGRDKMMEASSKQLEMWAQVEGDQECFARALITRASLAQEQCIGLANINRQNS
jgi:hypothetical protein